MQKKLMSWKTKGMNRDMSVSAFSPEFSFENRNLRLSTNEGNTQLSWVNEKGTGAVSIRITGQGSNSIEGVVIGQAVLNHQLVLFTTLNTTGSYSGEGKPDRIYRFEYKAIRFWTMVVDGLQGELLYAGHLGFNAKYPIETLVRYEADHIQKVYWVDGINQPRLINIATPAAKRTWNDTSFDFVPTFEGGRIKVEKTPSGGGLFAPGVIQYCFSYINKYGQQSNLVDVSPLLYLTHSDRGASPEEKVNNSFTITLESMDNRFDSVRLYAIQRTSLNGEVYVRLLDTLPITAFNMTYTDNGTGGSSMDPYELLFIGGKEVSVLTMQDKDNTLFMGNITQKNSLVNGIQDYFDELRTTGGNPVAPSQEAEQLANEGEGIEPTHNEAHFGCGITSKSRTEKASGAYSHTFTLNEDNSKVTSFKGGDTYRLGFQLQKKTGEWLEPIFIDDIKNTFYPRTELISGTECKVSLPFAEAIIDLTQIGSEYGVNPDLYQYVRPVVVYPSIGDREVLCQGVLNPTVFNSLDRIDQYPYAQASWFFRPYTEALTQDQTISDSLYTVSSTLVTEGTMSASNPVLGSDRISVYATVLNMPIGSVDSFIESGILEIEKDKRKHLKIEIVGAVKLSTVNNYTDVLVLTKERTEPETENYAYIWTYKGCSYKKIFGLYSKMNRMHGCELWYTGGLGDTYQFSCFVYSNPNAALSTDNPGTEYTITFNKVDAYQTSELVAGQSAAFMHYDSLYSNQSIDETAKLKNIKQVEVQNSSTLYGTPFTPYDITKNTNNAEFFVDQSIVTLNSPDIEFNGEVQNYGTDGLHLRIIGAVPITANVSTHHITASSERLQSSLSGFGIEELNKNVYVSNSILTTNHGGQRLIAETLWNDALINSIGQDDDGNETIDTSSVPADFYVFPWQKSGSLNNDWRSSDKATSQLQTKQESTALYSMFTQYVTGGAVNFNSIGVQLHLQENEFIENLRLPGQTLYSQAINYYPNIDKVLYNKKTTFNGILSNTTNTESMSTVSMKYKSGSHAVIDMISETGNGAIPILPYGDRGGNTIGQYEGQSGTTFWGDSMVFSQMGINRNKLIVKEDLSAIDLDFLWLGELYKDVKNPFGGKSKASVQASKWQVGGEKVPLVNGKATIHWTEGDTYYQRYDCLKTYAFTPEDQNQIVEMLSFMCESHVNLDGRYDKNRGQTDNTAMNPTIFNLMNQVYDQQDNYFTYRQLDTENVEALRYPNQVTYSMTKEDGADIDLWTNVTLASILTLDGDKGQINSLNKLNNQLLAFQDTGLSQILYNENTQISTSQGVPIEIANSGKVQGSRYLSDSVGCSNKWSIVNTPMGIYFMDGHERSIYLFNGQLQNLSVSKGFNVWSKQHIPSPEVIWNPVDFENFVTYYDKMNQDVLFINKDEALAFSEKFGTFTSFYDYGELPYFSVLDDKGFWVKDNKGETINSVIQQHQTGKYCQFFGVNKPYSMTLVGNPEAQQDCIFTNLEFRANVVGEAYSGKVDTFDETFNETFHPAPDDVVPFLPFDYLETWDEYQHGYALLSYKNGSTSMQHFLKDGTAHLDRKFRMWRCDIPRDNVPATANQTEPSVNYTQDKELGITRFASKPVDRMRNPWLYIKLQKKAADENSVLNKTEVHDLVMTYYS